MTRLSSELLWQRLGAPRSTVRLARSFGPGPAALLDFPESLECRRFGIWAVNAAF